MNAAQYKVVKAIVSFPLMNTKKFAKMIKVEHSVVVRVQASHNYEQFLSDQPLEDLMAQFGDLFGGNPFGGKRR